MSQQIEIGFDPHEGQQYILDNRKRFNICCNGRRFGKTSLAVWLMLEKLEGKTAFFNATYRDLSEVWKMTKRVLGDLNLIEDKNEQLKQIQLTTGGTIYFFSLSDTNTGRGFFFDRVLIDECAKIRNLSEAWKQSIRPTLADRQGDCYFFSTPAGTANDFYRLFTDAKNKADWFTCQMPSSSNPYILPSEIESARQDMTKEEFLQEFDAQFVNFSKSAFFDAFDESKHVGVVQMDYESDIVLSFDFNHSPCTCVVFNFKWDGITIPYCFSVDGGLDALLFEMEWLRTELDNHNSRYFITGDNNGHSRSVLTLDTAYDMLFGFWNKQPEAITRNANFAHLRSRQICNRVLKLIPVTIDPNNAADLVRDLKLLQANERGGIDKSNHEIGHLADGFRYGTHWRYESAEIVKGDAEIMKLKIQETINFLDVEKPKNQNGFILK